MKILIIDNYDSFTYNLVQLVRKIAGIEPTVKRNNQIIMDEIEAFDKILLSPGPGIPVEAGLLLQIIHHYAPHKSILGVCLGHQAIGEVYGATLIKLDTLFHGVATPVNIIGEDSLFTNVPNSFSVGRYHSWTLSKKYFPDILRIIAEDEYGNIMAIRHKQYNLCGVQFHPESILTSFGEQIITNWINS